MEQKTSTAPAALTPEDYYLDGDSVVFTAAFHLKRGSCCGSGCRHCPYGNSPTGTKPETSGSTAEA